MPLLLLDDGGGGGGSRPIPAPLRGLAEERSLSPPTDSETFVSSISASLSATAAAFPASSSPSLSVASGLLSPPRQAAATLRLPWASAYAHGPCETRDTADRRQDAEVPVVKTPPSPHRGLRRRRAAAVAPAPPVRRMPTA